MAGRARPGQEKAAELDAVAHHVVQDAAALQRAVPEPRHVRAAVLFGRARQVRAAGDRCAARPDELAPARHRRREDLVLEIPVQ